MYVHLCRWYFIDGTFSLAPRQFTQLYVIRVPVGKTYATCVYALMSGKTQDEYEEMLTAVVHACRQLGYDADPDTVLSDFELAVPSLQSWGAMSCIVGVFIISSHSSHVAKGNLFTSCSA